MSVVFVDTSGWIALLNRTDSLHPAATSCFKRLAARHALLVTTSMVLAETGNGLSYTSSRHLMSKLRNRLRNSRSIEVVHADATLFERGWDMYEQRSDKEWDLVDCISFVLMADRAIQSVVTADHHFEQAGFIKLL